MTRIRIPAMLDPHVHLRGMAWAHKGDFFTETCAAVAGGYWAVFDMPNTPPHTVDQAALDQKLSHIDAQAVCDWGVYFCASAGGNWPAYSTVFDDVCGVKMFNNSTTGNLLVEDPAIRAGHYAHWPGGKIFANHAEDETCVHILDLVREYRKPTHILHVSTAYEVAIIRQAKADGLPVTCGVCPHHLWLTERDVTTLGGKGMMKPSLKTQADQDALWQGLADGVIDIVESDHAPHTEAEKESDPAPFGVPGLETTLPLLLTAMHQGRLTLEQIINLVSVRPREIYKITAPPDTYTLVDTDARRVIDGKVMHSKAGWSPFDGMTVRGRVLETWIRGHQVYDGEQVRVAPGFGRNLYA
jgi:dihydroorotase